MLADVYGDSSIPAEVCEALIDVDEGIQEWRYGHLKVVERIIGLRRPGSYLGIQATLAFAFES